MKIYPVGCFEGVRPEWYLLKGVIPVKGVIPAQAGILWLLECTFGKIPACAGMTTGG